MIRTAFLLFSCLWLSTAHAQNFTGELFAGMAGTQVSGDLLQGFDKGGIIAGAGVRMHFNKKSNLGFRLEYFQKGSRKPSDLENGDPSYYLLRLNYIEVPVQYRYHFYKKFFLEAGPSFGFLVGSSEQDQDGELPSREEFKKTDISLAGGLGYSLSPKCDFMFGYTQSIVPVRPHNGGETYRLNKGQYNSAISFTFTFNLLTGE